MRRVETIEGLREVVRGWRREGHAVGLVAQLCVDLACLREHSIELEIALARLHLRPELHLGCVLR